MSKCIGPGIIALLVLSLAGDEALSQRGGMGRPGVVGGYPARPAAVVRPAPVVVRPAAVVRPAPVVARPAAIGGVVARPGPVVRPAPVAVRGGPWRFGTVGGYGAVGVRPGGVVAVGPRTRLVAPSVLAARGVAVRQFYTRPRTWFTPAWYTRYPLAWRPAAWRPGVVWAAATWPLLAGWWGWRAQPIYYDYGNNIVYQGDQVLVGGQPQATADQYYQQAVALAQVNPAGEQPGDEWRSLGVFALVQGAQADPSAVFQLAANQAGIIRGNYVNDLAGTNLPVRGAVDPVTQRAAWTVGDNKQTVYDTGIYNLTRDEAPILVHFGPDQTQQWLLVRIKQDNP
jgi:hypothetical protein